MGALGEKGKEMVDGERSVRLQNHRSYLDIGGEASKTDVELGSHLEDFGEIHSYGLELDSVS